MIFFILVAEIDPVPNRKSSKSGVERMLEFGKELYQLSQRLEKENGENEQNVKMLEVCDNQAPINDDTTTFRTNENVSI